MLNLCHFDNVGVNAVSHGLEATAVSAEAGLFPGFTLRATVAVNTLRVVTFQAKPAWCHAGDSRQNVEFLAGQLAIVIVIAVLFVRAFTQQEEIIAQFELLQAIEIITRDALEIEAIHTLSVFISLDGLRCCRTSNLGAHDLLEIGRLCFIGGGSRQRPANAGKARICRCS